MVHSSQRKFAMKIVHRALPLFAPLAVILLGTSCAIAQAKQETERRVTMKDLPAPVQATVKKESKGAVIRGLSKEVKNGQTFYEVELSTGQKMRRNPLCDIKRSEQIASLLDQNDDVELWP